MLADSFAADFSLPTRRRAKHTAATAVSAITLYMNIAGPLRDVFSYEFLSGGIAEITLSSKPRHIHNAS